MPRIQVREVIDHREREAVFRLRYRVYVTERRCPQAHADHARRRIEEPLDAPGRSRRPGTGVILGAFKSGRLVGTVRCNALEDASEDYASGYRTDLFELEPGHEPTIITKLCVERAERGMQVMRALALSIYRHGLRIGCRVSFMDCNPPLLPVFQRFGFRQIAPSFQHAEYGRVHPMFLVLHDRAHLAEVQSPFLRYAELMNPDCPSVSHFRRVAGSIMTLSTGDELR